MWSLLRKTFSELSTGRTSTSEPLSSSDEDVVEGVRHTTKSGREVAQQNDSLKRQASLLRAGRHRSRAFNAHEIVADQAASLARDKMRVGEAIRLGNLGKAERLDEVHKMEENDKILRQRNKILVMEQTEGERLRCLYGQVASDASVLATRKINRRSASIAMDGERVRRMSQELRHPPSSLLDAIKHAQGVH